MRVVLLTAHSASGDVQHRYVARKLAEEFSDELVAIVVATGVKKSLREKIVRLARRYSPSQLVSRSLARVYRLAAGAEARRRQTFGSMLFPEGENGEMPFPELVRFVPSHNRAECIALLELLGRTPLSSTGR